MYARVKKSNDVGSASAPEMEERGSVPDDHMKVGCFWPFWLLRLIGCVPDHMMD